MNKFFIAAVIIVGVFIVGYWMGNESGLESGRMMFIEYREGEDWWERYRNADPNDTIDCDVDGITIVGLPFINIEETLDFTIENCTFGDIDPNKPIKIL